MKIVLIILVVLVLSGFIGFFVLGLMSQSGEAGGLVGGRLAKCPDKPNCVCTEFEADLTHYTEPVLISRSDTSGVLSGLKTVIQEMGGKVQKEDSQYLAATFTSSFFRFVDDLEIRIDLDQKTIHMRSSSRVGHSDRGVNKKRIERLKKLYQ